MTAAVAQAIVQISVVDIVVGPFVSGWTNVIGKNAYDTNVTRELFSFRRPLIE